MKKLQLFILLFVLGSSTYSQKQTDKWFFGENAALDFTSGNPVVISGVTHNIPEGCSSVCTASGTLLFYTEGVNVWDTTHSAMPNGFGLMGDLSTTQSALIVPSPTSTSQYYIFTLAADGGVNGFRYSMVDMTLNGGLGDVTSKNVIIQDSVTEKQAAVKDAAGTGYWIVVHRWGTDAFESYHLTTGGIQPAVVSHTGIVYTTSAIQNTYGQMKFSACGAKLGVAAGYLNQIELFDFNRYTGIVSNPITIPMFEHVYGLEFSQDGNLLYVCKYGSGTTLAQYNLALTTTAAIIASSFPLSITSDIYALQLASNGKIYVVKSFSQFLGVINSPATLGSGCNYVDNGVDLDPNFMGNTAALGLPGFMQTYLYSEISCSTDGIVDNQNNTTTELLYPNPSASEFTFSAQSLLVLSPAIELTIYSCTGRLIEKFNSHADNLSFGKSYSPGVYFAHLKTVNLVKVYKLIKTQ